MKYLKHKCVTNITLYCLDYFYGQGARLIGHASYFRSTKSVTEIHMDYLELWYYKHDTNEPTCQVSFLQVLTHKIGHTLGLAHSSELHSVMYPYYLEPLYERSLFYLTDDDIKGIQYLYREPSKDTTTSLSSSSPSSTPSSTTSTTTSSTKTGT